MCGLDSIRIQLPIPRRNQDEDQDPDCAAAANGTDEATAAKEALGSANARSGTWLLPISLSRVRADLDQLRDQLAQAPARGDLGAGLC